MKLEIEDAVNNAIKKVKEDSIFLTLVFKEFELPKELKELFKEYNIIYQVSQVNDFPDVGYFCEFSRYEKNEFQVVYSFELHFSKLENVYKYSFGFEVKNHDDDECSGGILDGENEIPYTKSQHSFLEKLEKILSHLGFIKLSVRDYGIVLNDIKFEKNNLKFFNEQPNVDMLFFNDLRSLYK